MFIAIKKGTFEDPMVESEINLAFKAIDDTITNTEVPKVEEKVEVVPIKIDDVDENHSVRIGNQIVLFFKTSTLYFKLNNYFPMVDMYTRGLDEEGKESVSVYLNTEGTGTISTHSNSVWVYLSYCIPKV